MSAEKRILVTGGAGYVGSILTEKLLERGYRVVVLDNFVFTDMGIRYLFGHPNLAVIEGDIRDARAVKEAMNEVESVIHLAAIANDPSGELNPGLTRSTNFRAYPLILKQAKNAGVRRFVNASTFGVYGIKYEPNVTEDLPLEPLKEYSICKAKSEEITKEFNSPDFITTSLRCATVCGWSRRMRFDLIVNTLTSHALLYKKITVFGGDQQRPQIHIQDITDYFVELVTVPSNLIGGEVFNAGGQNASILDIAETIRAVIGEEIEIENTPPRDDERSYHVTSEKIARTLGFRPKRTIHEAVRDITQAYRQGLWRDPLDSIYHNVKRMKVLGLG